MSVEKKILASRKKAKKGASRGVLLWFILFGVIVGSIIMLATCEEKKIVDEARLWPVIQGTIVSADVKAKDSRNSKGGRTHTYYPEAIYEFAFNGQRYGGNVFRAVSMGTMVSERDIQRDKLKSYPVGGGVSISYDPKDPSRSLVLGAYPAGPIFWSVVYSWTWIGWGLLGVVGIFLSKIQGTKEISYRIERFLVSGLLLLLGGPALIVGFPNLILILIGGFFGLIGVLGLVGNIYEIALLVTGHSAESGEIKK
jgi:hypothetical protein